MNYITPLYILLITSLLSCAGNTNQKLKMVEPDQDKAYQIVSQMVQKVGDYEKLASKKNVEYRYAYVTPDQKRDESLERYIFGGELSYGRYERHERTLSHLKGTIEQGYDGHEYWLKHEGKVVLETDDIQRAAFNRQTNFYWITMMQKMLDPDVNYEYIGEKIIADQKYDVVKIGFDTHGGPQRDIYQLYINQETRLADQFLFTVADFGVMDTPYLMELEYETIEGILIPTQRRYKKSDWDANLKEGEWTHVTWSDIKFNRPFTRDDFLK